VTNWDGARDRNESTPIRIDFEIWRRLRLPQRCPHLQSSPDNDRDDSDPTEEAVQKIPSSNLLVGRIQLPPEQPAASRDAVRHPVAEKQQDTDQVAEETADVENPWRHHVALRLIVFLQAAASRSAHFRYRRRNTRDARCHARTNSRGHGRSAEDTRRCRARDIRARRTESADGDE